MGILKCAVYPLYYSHNISTRNMHICTLYMHMYMCMCIVDALYIVHVCVHVHNV